MKVFVLDDNKERLKQFKQRCLERGWLCVTAETVAESKKAFLNNTFQLAFLDHDLGDEQFVDSSNEETGAGLARWLVEENVAPTCTFFIHSFNPAGAKNMLGELPSASYVPGVWLKKEFDKYFPLIGD